MEVAGCRCPRNSCSEDFPNSYGNYEAEPIFSKVENLASAAFLKMNSTTNIYPNFKHFCLNILKAITAFTNIIGFTFLRDQSDP